MPIAEFLIFIGVLSIVLNFLLGKKTKSKIHTSSENGIVGTHTMMSDGVSGFSGVRENFTASSRTDDY